MSLKLRGANTFQDKVTNIGPNGLWLLVDDREYFVPFSDYPVFQDATVEQIFNVQRVAPGQYHWPDLDTDMELGALAHPDQFPLVWRDKRK